MTMGDSKTARAGWQPWLVADLSTLNRGSWNYYGAGVEGATVASYRTNLASLINSIPVESRFPKYVLMNLGINDAGSGSIDAAWEANYEGLIDDIRGYWPNVPMYLAYPWRVNNDAEAATLHTAIDHVIAARAGVAAGPDEAVVMKAGDNGATNYGVDGIHYSNAGYVTWADAWSSIVPHPLP